MSNRPRPRSKCNTIKNACKYCLAQVSNRNGLQCQGACKKWAHYKCLHYTPGKISDIKAGIIKVMCPCPDCETTQEKEYLTNPPYTCSNQKCPGNARGPAKCDSVECPSNRDKARQEQKCSTRICVDDAVEGPTQAMYPTPRKPYHARLPDPRSSPIPKTYKSQRSASRSRMPKRHRTVDVGCTSSNNSLDDPACQNQNAIEYEEEEEEEQDLMVHALHEMSGTVGMLSKQIKELMCRINKIGDNVGSEPR